MPGSDTPAAATGAVPAHAASRFLPVLPAVSHALQHRYAVSYTTNYDEVGMNIRPIGDEVDLLGESCIWSHAEQALYWIDVRGKCVRRLDHRTGQVETFALPELLGSIALHADGGLVVALQSGLAHFDLPAGTLRWIAHPHETYPNQRFNDGRCDRQGRFWAGTMDDVERGLRGERAAQPLAGRLLAIEVGVRGLAEPSYVAGRPGHSSLGRMPPAPPETSRISDA
jgi:hypothetical protein